MPRAETTTTSMAYNEALIEGAAATDLVQAALLIAVVFVPGEPDRFLDHVRQLGALRRRVSALLERSAAAHDQRPPRARSRR